MLFMCHYNEFNVSFFTYVEEGVVRGKRIRSVSSQAGWLAEDALYL